MAEVWLPVVGNDRYQVSSEGRVRNSKGLVLKINHSSIYPFVMLYSGSRASAKNHRIHILVARAFLGPAPAGLEVRHLDGDNTNNHLSNLKYGTSAENKNDTVRHGRHHNAVKIECSNGHPFDDENTYIHNGKRQCRTCHSRDERKKRHG